MHVHVAVLTCALVVVAGDWGPATAAPPRIPDAAEVAREAVFQGATSKPSSVSWAPGRIDLFVRGPDNALWHKWYANSAWSNWESLGGGLSSGPDVTSFAAGHLDVFVRGTDNALWHRYFVNNAWSGWESLGGQITSDPAAVSWGSGRIDVFARGTDNALWHIWFSGQWMSWESLGGSLVSGPGAASWSPGRLDVFTRGADNTLQHTWFDGSWAGRWESLGGSISSDPAAVAFRAGHLDVFARGADNTLRQLSYEGGWSQWVSWPGAISSGLDASTQGDMKIDVFALGTDNNVSQKSFSAGWGNWTTLGAPALPTAVLAVQTATITPMPVTSVPVTFSGSPSALTITWPAVPNADQYKIDRVKEGDACCNRTVYTRPPATTTTDALDGSTAAFYQYTVTAMMPNRAQVVLQGTYEVYGKLDVELAPPPTRSKLKVVDACHPATTTGGPPPASIYGRQVEVTRAMVSWDAVAGASVYLVERQVSGSNTWVTVACTSGLQVYERTRTDLPPAETVYPGAGSHKYKVTAVSATGAAGWNTGFLMMQYRASAPSTLTASRAGNAVTLCWYNATGSFGPSRIRITSNYGTDVTVPPDTSPGTGCSGRGKVLYGVPDGTWTFKVTALYNAYPKSLETDGPSVSITVAP